MDVNWAELIIGLVLSVTVGEILKTLPKNSERIVKFAARRLANKEMAKIRENEWLSSLDEQPSDVSKLFHACENLVASYCIEVNYISFLEKLGYLTLYFGTLAWFIDTVLSPVPMGVNIKSIPLWGACIGFTFSLHILHSYRIGVNLPIRTKSFRNIIHIFTFICYSQVIHGISSYMMYVPIMLWSVIGIIDFKNQRHNAISS